MTANCSHNTDGEKATDHLARKQALILLSRTVCTAEHLHSGSLDLEERLESGRIAAEDVEEFLDLLESTSQELRALADLAERLEASSEP